MKKIFKWTLPEMLVAVIGLFLYALSVNVIIVPNNLYNGGILGISQLIRTLIIKTTGLNIKFDISTIIYYILNIPLFALAWKNIGKTFFFRTVFCVTVSTVFLSVIPESTVVLTSNMLTNVIIGGLLCGLGCGLGFMVGASTGGTDIISMALTKKFKALSVGTFNLSFNCIIYAAAAFAGGIETLVYSVIYSLFDSMTSDKLHIRNISTTTMIFSKKHPQEIIDYIIKDLDRSATYWDAIGGYSGKKTYVTYTALSKYERILLNQQLKKIDKDAFVLVRDGGVSVLGDFEKRL